MATIAIPEALAQYAAGHKLLITEGRTAQEILISISRQYPELAPYLFDKNNELNAFVGYFLNDETDIRYLEGLNTLITPQDKLTILPATAGG